MRDYLRAFLIHDHPEAFKALEEILKDLCVEIWNIKTCDLVESLFAQHKPYLVFIELSAWEGSSAQLVALANQPDLATGIIVVGTLTDIDHYGSAVARGAFSYITPPFWHDGLNIIVHAAAMDARERRETMAQALVASSQV